LGGSSFVPASLLHVEITHLDLCLVREHVVTAGVIIIHQTVLRALKHILRFHLLPELFPALYKVLIISSLPLCFLTEFPPKAVNKAQYGHNNEN
jgi:hypothetical protein